jgi:hypothetical protein
MGFWSPKSPRLSPWGCLRVLRSRFSLAGRLAF